MVSESGPFPLSKISMDDLTKILLRVLPFLVIIIGIAVVIKKGKVKKENLYLQNPASYKKFFLWWASFLALILVTEFSLYYFDLLEVGKWDDQLFPSILKILGIVVLAPIAEELVFRGLIMFKLRQFKVGRHAAVFIQAVIFLLLHSISFDNSFSSNIAVIQIFGDSVLYAYAKQHTKSLYTPIAMHATGNLIAVLEQFFI